MRAGFLTLGCKVNSYETEAVWELLRDRGYDRGEFSEDNDVYVINTCSVTNTGEAKSRKMIREAARHPGAVVVVMGCFSQLKAEEVAGIEGVSIVVGTDNRHRIPEYLEEYLRIRRPINRVAPLLPQTPFEDLHIRRFERHRRAFLKIQDGCDHFCSYCIIPYARGRVRSRQPVEVLREAEELVANGFREIVLTGIHTGGYGTDLSGYRFSDLLRDLTKIPGLSRIRISSIEISELTEEVVGVIAASPRIVPHLHVPLQSGSDRILRKMNRKYDTAEYARHVAFLRQRIPDLALTTDVIVGFPGETDADFDEMFAFIRQIGFSELHVFPFSPRAGTPAAKMPDPVSPEVRKSRVAALLSLSDELAKAYIRSQIGRVLEVMPETFRDGWLVGHSGNYIRVRFSGPESLVGVPTPVILTEESYPLSLAVMADPLIPSEALL
jgi:threonylcarbamoyladenosine tRNA methylthiotransferase MtaB